MENETNKELIITEDSVAHIKVNVDKKDMEPYKQHYFKEKQKTITLKGFRKGKAPLDIVAHHFKDEATQFAKNNLIYNKYYKLLQDYRLQALNEPKLDLINETDDGKVEATFVVEVLQPVELNQYLGLELQQMPKREVDDGVKQTLSEVRNMYPKLTKITSVEKNSVVNVDFSMVVDDEEVESQKNLRVALGRGDVFKDFEDALVGMSENKEKEFSAVFPETYQAEKLRGKKASFKVLIHEIFDKSDYTDEELAGVLKYESVEQMLDKLRVEVENKYKDDEHLFYENQLLGQLLTAHQFKIPQRLLAAEEQRLVAEKPDMKPEEVKEVAERFVRTDIVLNSIYDRHPDIHLKNEDVELKLGELAKKANDTKEGIVKKLQESGKLQTYLNYLKNCQVISFLIDMADKKEMVGVESVLDVVDEDDRIRGMTKDVVMYDEVQDILDTEKEITKVEE
jgi:trigger factor